MLLPLSGARLSYHVVAVLVGAIFLFHSCTDKGTEAPRDPITASRTSVTLPPASTTTVQILGGSPPYAIISQPDPRVANASFEDSTASPANLVITTPFAATEDDSTIIVVGESEASARGSGSTGDASSVTITVSIVQLGSISYADDLQPIWDVNCQHPIGNPGVNCHATPTGSGAPFSLDRFVGWSNLFFFPVTNRSCGVIYRVAPGAPDSSLLHLMVSGQGSCPRMPFSLFPGDTLSSIEQTKIRDWIAQGAPNN